VWVGNRARVFCDEPCLQTRHCSSTSLSRVLTTSDQHSGYAFSSAMTASGAYPVRAWMSSKRASGALQGNPAENFSIDAQRPRDFNCDGVASASSLHFRVQWSTKTFSRGHRHRRYGRTVSRSRLLSIGVSFSALPAFRLGSMSARQLHPIRGVGRVECCCECARVGLQAGGFS
jgi:hypothetical protein